MERINPTFVEECIVLDLSGQLELEIIYFVPVLVVHLVFLTGNSVLSTASIFDSRLNSGPPIPMYFFLANLSFLDICYTASSVPSTLVSYLVGRNSTSISGYASQMYFSFAMGSTECVLLSMMAYDRYVAICNPLRYPVIMNRRVCVQIAGSSWVTGCLTALVETGPVIQLSLCGNSIINHFTCEILALLKMACVDTSMVQLIMLVISILLLPLPMLLICVSYAFILSNILRISTVDGRSKAFSTCAAHLTVVVLFFGTALSMYLKPSPVNSQEIDKFMALIYAGLTPMLNPIIYSLLNNDVKMAVKKLLRRHSFIAILTSVLKQY
ncbi:olfactory receptor 13F1-like [Meriones unguiculatus]|uniref:olfactory receptor 13F1-like n=1 Tax=Meriones unguiculatus TaxID=10047 RepID=UPI00293F225D|nr:olfactory receptor 13F1-like [Meriones unguiculatus]